MQPSLFVIDDDSVVRDALRALFALEGFDVHCFENGAHFLSTPRAENPGCVILDVQMPALSGLEVLRQLRDENYPAPVVMISGQSDISIAVEAMKCGAYDFIEKPLDISNFLIRVKEAAATQQGGRSDTQPATAASLAEQILTPRERDVLYQITDGASNKEAGRHLGISPRTVEVHRARIMDKLGARNAADLVRIVLKGEKQAAAQAS
jgi:two-component system response regulator FixJ